MIPMVLGGSLNCDISYWLQGWRFVPLKHHVLEAVFNDLILQLQDIENWMEIWSNEASVLQAMFNALILSSMLRKTSHFGYFDTR
jgi:hypothetical protein